MKKIDVTSLLGSLITNLGNKRNRLHEIRISCKKIQALLLLAKKGHQRELYLKSINKTRKSLERFRDQDVLIQTAEKLFTNDKTNREFVRIKSFVKRQPEGLRNVRINKAMNDLVILNSSDLEISTRFNLKTSLKKVSHAYERCNKSNKADHWHILRKKITILKSQLEMKTKFLSKKKIDKKNRYKKIITRLGKLKKLIGDERDLGALQRRLSRQKQRFPQSLNLIKSKKNKIHQKILIKSSLYINLFLA